MIIDPVTGWFEVVQYDEKGAIIIMNLVKTTWMPRYPRQIEIMCDQGK